MRGDFLHGELDARLAARNARVDVAPGNTTHPDDHHGPEPEADHPVEAPGRVNGHQEGQPELGPAEPKQPAQESDPCARQEC